MVERKSLRGVAFERDGRVVAVCLDHYMTASCGTWQELRDSIYRMMETHYEAAIESGQKPFESLPAAPQRYWDLFNSIERSERAIEAAERRESGERVWQVLPSIVQIGQGAPAFG